jgi:hypothetical protein
MRLTLFWYMILSPFVEFPDPARVTPGEAKRGARLPSAEALHLRRLWRNLFAALREKICPDTVTRRAALPKQKSELAAGRRYCPEAVTEQKAGYRRETLSGPKFSSGSRPRMFTDITASSSSAQSPWAKERPVACAIAEGPGIVLHSGRGPNQPARSWRQSHSFRSETRKRQGLRTWLPLISPRRANF